MSSIYFILLLLFFICAKCVQQYLLKPKVQLLGKTRVFLLLLLFFSLFFLQEQKPFYRPVYIMPCSVKHNAYDCNERLCFEENIPCSERRVVKCLPL